VEAFISSLFNKSALGLPPVFGRFDYLSVSNVY
jgi:hypothetical protein